MLGSSNNWNIIQFTTKKASSEDFDAVNKVVLDGINGNMAYLLQLGKYGAINAEYPITMRYYVIRYLYKPYTLQEDKTTDGQVSKAGEILFKTEYRSLMKAEKWYW